MPPLHHLVRFLLFVITASALACNGDALVEPSLGTIEITTSTLGTEPDADGYSVQIDAEPIQAIAAAGTLHTRDVVGDHSVRLDGVAVNCTVVGENPKRISLSAGATTTVSFVVMCAGSGVIHVTSSTTGFFSDPDGYLIGVDGELQRPLGVSSSESISGVGAGHHSVELSGVAANCEVGGSNQQELEVNPGGTATIAFDVDCSISPPIVFGKGGQILVVNEDGTGLRSLTPGEESLHSPVWSPDGGRIAFLKDEDIYVMNPDGTNRVRLTEGARALRFYGWSPDGARMWFEREAFGECGTPECFTLEIWLMGPDGSNLTRLVEGSAPTWSSDGDTIAFEWQGQIHVINIDGTARRQLTNHAPPRISSNPAWSPDGSRIAFTTYRDEDPSRVGPAMRDLYLINPDGSGLVNLEQGNRDHEAPVWSPNGNRIAFGTYADAAMLDADVGVMNRDGTGEMALTRTSDFEYGPVWSPEGTEILFAKRTGYPLAGVTELYVMSTDGGIQTNLSRGPGSGPNWRSK
jgi:Tol biopolymer transport system component